MRVGIVHTAGSVCRCAQWMARGLAALGHESVLVDSEEVALRAGELAERCDRVMDHTDTYRGQGAFRSVVRQLLENRGARIVGSGARACFLADDKAAAKARLSAAGIPTPPGVVLTPTAPEIPAWLQPPLILKPAFEHMSRGMIRCRTRTEALSAAAGLLAGLGQPVLAEIYLPGRELGLCVLEGPAGMELLPVAEWRMEGHREGVLTGAFKDVEPPTDRRDIVPAELPPPLLERVQALAFHAFRTLGLRDYARFDVRLTPAGTPFFLEANTTPSMEGREAFALSASWAGLDYPALLARLLAAGDGRWPGLCPAAAGRSVRVALPGGPVALEIPEGVHPPPESTRYLAGLLDIRPGERVLELGCGCGLLSIAAARQGAGQVVATDLDPRALENTAANARRNAVEHAVQVRAGAWYEAWTSETGETGDGGRFHVIVATPPQTPGPRPFGPRYGGFDGTQHLLAVVEGAAPRLVPGTGRLWLLAISLADMTVVRRRLEACFSRVTVAAETERTFTAEEYERMAPDLFGHVQALRAAGRAEFREIGGGRYAFRNLFIRAEGPRST